MHLRSLSFARFTRFHFWFFKRPCELRRNDHNNAAITRRLHHLDYGCVQGKKWLPMVAIHVP